MIPLAELFEIKYGVNLELNSMKIDKSGVDFVSRTSKNNGVSGKVRLLESIKPIPPGTISVAGGGSVMESFLQPKPYYSGRDLYYLTPKVNMTDNQKLYYCMCLRLNKYRYNYGRQANKTLSSILVPSIDEIPEWVNKRNLLRKFVRNSVNINVYDLHAKPWRIFTYDYLFQIEGGYYNKKPPEESKTNYSMPFVGASENNNGITSYHSTKDIDIYHKDGSMNHNEDRDQKIFKGNCITVANDGNSVASSFYQEKDFTASHSVNILRIKNHELNKYIALFLCVLIKNEKYRWNYGRKWRPTRMPHSEIKLPVNVMGEPDWQFMEDYIKSLPYSASL